MDGRLLAQTLIPSCQTPNQALTKAIRLGDAAELLHGLAEVPQGRDLLPLPTTMSILTGLPMR
jgi:hypothetical protein